MAQVQTYSSSTLHLLSANARRHLGSSHFHSDFPPSTRILFAGLDILCQGLQEEDDSLTPNDICTIHSAIQKIDHAISHNDYFRRITNMDGTPDEKMALMCNMIGLNREYDVLLDLYGFDDVTPKPAHCADCDEKIFRPDLLTRFHKANREHASISSIFKIASEKLGEKPEDVQSIWARAHPSEGEVSGSRIQELIIGANYDALKILLWKHMKRAQRFIWCDSRRADTIQLLNQIIKMWYITPCYCHNAPQCWKEKWNYIGHDRARISREKIAGIAFSTTLRSLLNDTDAELQYSNERVLRPHALLTSTHQLIVKAGEMVRLIDSFPQSPSRPRMVETFPLYNQRPQWVEDAVRRVILSGGGRPSCDAPCLE